MFLIFIESHREAMILFSASVLVLIASLLFSLQEIRLSIIAINLNLQDIEDSEAGEGKAQGL